MKTIKINVRDANVSLQSRCPDIKMTRVNCYRIREQRGGRHLWTCRSSRPRSLLQRGPRFAFDAASRCSSNPWTYAPHLRDSVTRAPRIIVYETSIQVLRQRCVESSYQRALAPRTAVAIRHLASIFHLEHCPDWETTSHHVDHNRWAQSTPVIWHSKDCRDG